MSVKVVFRPSVFTAKGTEWLDVDSGQTVGEVIATLPFRFGDVDVSLNGSDVEETTTVVDGDHLVLVGVPHGVETDKRLFARQAALLAVLAASGGTLSPLFAGIPGGGILTAIGSTASLYLTQNY